MKFVYHGSPMGGLNLIKPRVSTHGKAYVYALPEKAIIFNYPNRPDFLPDRGKDDLIQRAIMFANGDADHPVVTDVRQFHPDILDRVLDGIRAKQD